VTALAAPVLFSTQKGLIFGTNSCQSFCTLPCNAWPPRNQNIHRGITTMLIKQRTWYSPDPNNDRVLLPCSSSLSLSTTSVQLAVLSPRTKSVADTNHQLTINIFLLK
jgi:hypothetical protein